MKFVVITLFPKMVAAPLGESMVAKALAKSILELEIKDLRDYCEGKHRVADDAPFGGGGGMVLKAEPLIKAVEACKEANPEAKVFYLGPQGKRLEHSKIMECAAGPDKCFILICGHYEGVDQRVLDSLVDEEISIGDYVLTGGELAACVFIDAVTRQLPGALGDENSAKNDSFFNGLLDTPHYTRPAHLSQGDVPAVLLSGNHEEVTLWRREQALLATLKRRPDLLDTAPLTEKDREFLKQHKRGLL
jgi:tRNA (guanine37-N1)-methyltransferase